MNESSEEPAYQLRGHRVPSMNEQSIALKAVGLCNALGIKKSTFTTKNIGEFILDLEDYIQIIPIEDSQWIDIADAHVDTSTLTICMPDSLYRSLHSAKPDAIRIFLHELGHLFLAHKANLHFSDSHVKMNQDSEWQADFFAEAIIQHLKLPRGDQLEFKF